MTLTGYLPLGQGLGDQVNTYLRVWVGSTKDFSTLPPIQQLPLPPAIGNSTH